MRRVHVVILTAVGTEYRAAKAVDAGAWEGSHWEEEPGPNNLPVAFRTFRGKGDRELRVAVVQAAGMAGVAAANALLPVVEACKPQCIAMSGVCAGHPRKTNLGDVIAPDRIFFYDLGKREPEGVKPDTQTYNLREDWKVRLEHFGFAKRFQNEEWWKKRPVPYEWQENWVLAMLHQGVSDPASHPECDAYCPQWGKVIKALRKAGDVAQGTLALTEQGKTRIGSVLIEHRNRVPDLSPTGEVFPFNVHVEPMASGNQVVEDEKVWDELSAVVRKTVGLEMEAATIGAVAHSQRDKKLEFLVMKGVMDRANQHKGDHFKDFAARASAECLLAFLREQLDVETVPGVDDLLVPGTEPLPENPPPSALLNARYEVVPFHEQGREAILSELDRWCDEGLPVAVRLVHAEGGAGKTRLAIEWMRRLEPRGWKVGFLAKSVKEDWFEKLWELGQQVVVVLDYAEGRSNLGAVLLRVLSYAQQKGSGTTRRIRLLLLARNAGDWWQSLRQTDAALGTWLDATPPRELPALATKVEEREQVFNEAAERFAKKRGKPYQRRDRVPLADGRFERVLYLHMAALATVEGLAVDANTLMDVVLDHEERFWEARAQQDDVRRALQSAKARQVVAAATLRGGFADSNTAVRTLVRILGHMLSENEEELLRLLHRIYQRAGAKEAAFLPALEPDLLGEGMVLRVAALRQGEDQLPPDWIDHVFPRDEGANVVRTGFEVLGRASAAQPEVVRAWIDRLLDGALKQRGRLALEAAKAVGRRTALSVLGDVLAERLEAQGDVELARELEAAGIPDSTTSLRRVAVWVSHVLVPKREVEGPPPSPRWWRRVANRIGRLAIGKSRAPTTAELSERAMRLNNLGTRLSAVGRREEALTAAQEAMDLYRALAQRQPEAFLPDLAVSLNNLGNRLSELGRREEALTAAQEAVDLRRTLAQRQPEAFLPDLALSLNNLGNRLSALGRREEALTAAQEAVDLYRDLAQRQPEAFLPDLAMSLNNLGPRLSELGRREEALTAAQEAVGLYRDLAQRQPEAFLPDLAGSLNNLGSRLIAVGRREEALTAAQEAADLYRDLAQRQPEAFLPDLAGSLNNLGPRLGELGRREEALTAAQEAVDLYRDLAQRQPEAFLPNLAMSLNNLGPRLGELGRREEALTAAQEAVDLYRDLAQRHLEAFLPDLAMSLNNLGPRLSAVGRREEALTAAQEAVDLRRTLAQRQPEAFLPNLAMSLNNLGPMLSAVGRREEALTAVQEAVDLRRTLAQRQPEAFLPDLAMSLNNLGNRLSELGRREEALTAVQEAVDLRRTLAQRQPEAFLPKLAMSLNNLGEVLSELGRHEEALKAKQEAEELRMRITQRSQGSA